MKNILLLSSVILSSFTYSQTNNDLKTEIEKIKNDIVELKTEIQSVKSHNMYLKKSLDINTPILEVKNNNNEYRITKVIGNKNEKSISLNFLIESKDENKTSILDDFSIVDLNGNEYKFDFNKSSYTYPKLSVNVPLNIKATFKDVNEEIKIIKLFKFKTRNEPENNTLNFNKSAQEFRDLNVIWE
ncbi:transposase [Empedobacter falsenii]|uniref:transposase n=1 Tax=unclassified Empedobacter TaxID=2643773 RepID=UPI0025749C7E|nr:MULTISPECIES: transposase [unclassified Empedobacter]MDM1524307.1 transposase [Empedobacter sp. 225-1]MDM1544235.1 transposase [Empedobacter sp. 189-2]